MRRALPRARLIFTRQNAKLKHAYVKSFETDRVQRQRLQASAFSRYSRRGAADRILGGSRGKLHGGRGTAARTARRVARTLCVVGTRRRAVNWLDATAQSRPSRTP